MDKIKKDKIGIGKKELQKWTKLKNLKNWKKRKKLTNE